MYISTFFRASISTLLLLSMLLSLHAQGLGVTPVPQSVSIQLNGNDQPLLTWAPVEGHGPQHGLTLANSFDYTSYQPNTGQDQVNWQVGDPQEFRDDTDNEATLYYSSYGVDVMYFNANSGPDNQGSIFSLDRFDHTPFPFWPGPIGGTGDKAKFDQIHYFNAGSQGAADYVDLSPLGVTHPDQVEWYPGTGGYQYSYLLIDDNDGDMDEVAAAVLIRADRTFGTFDVNEHIIYAEGQTTYRVYRREQGAGNFTEIASGITDLAYLDTDPLQPGVRYEYVVTADAQLFGESDHSAVVSLISTGISSLPVEWISFQAEAIAAHQVRLSWQTASEQQNAGFTVERSLDRETFAAIGEVASQGEGQGLRQYLFTDTRAPQRTVYYRLRQTDFDGEVHYSDLREVKAEAFRSAAIKLYPNPASEVVHVAGLTPGNLHTLRIVDMQGNELKRLRLSAHSNGQLSLRLSDLSDGLYRILIDDQQNGYQVAFSLIRR
jgi:hypothetical protein